MNVRSPLILIGGTSHSGKSTLAADLGARMGWPVVSTDTLGRHPGRPWPEVLERNKVFFATLPDQVIYEFLTVHHHNIWPLAQRIIGEQTGGFIMEGSALRPAFLTPYAKQSVFLYAKPELIRARIHANSHYDALPTDHQFIIDKFITRSLKDNDVQLNEAQEHGIPCINAGDPDALKTFVARY